MQTIVKGIENLNQVLNGCRKILLVIDGSFSFLNIKDEVERINVPFVKFSDFTSNPLYDDVCKGVDVFNQEQCDAILAVGGGSCIDVAKCIKLYCKMPESKLYLEQEYKDTGIKLIAIPTTAGTGSESTRYAVIYYDDKKQSVTHDSIIPNVAILEPKVLETLPLYQKKCTLLDAYCQGIESWWSVNSTKESKKLSMRAVQTIAKWWREYIFDNNDEANGAIMQAANWAGQAICITQTTAPHAFSYKISSLFNLPHGHAVAIGLPEIWNYMLNHLDKCIDKRGKGYLENTFDQISQAMGITTGPTNAIADFRQMLNLLGIKNPVSDNRESDIDLLSCSVNPIRLKNNPIELDANVIKYIYDIIIQ